MLGAIGSAWSHRPLPSALHPPHPPGQERPADLHRRSGEVGGGGLARWPRCRRRSGSAPFPVEPAARGQPQPGGGGGGPGRARSRSPAANPFFDYRRAHRSTGGAGVLQGRSAVGGAGAALVRAGRELGLSADSFGQRQRPRAGAVAATVEPARPGGALRPFRGGQEQFAECPAPRIEVAGGGRLRPLAAGPAHHPPRGAVCPGPRGPGGRYPRLQPPGPAG